jgi:hypothetical protein
MDAWLNAARNNLSAAGFVISDDVSHDERSFSIVARRSRFEVTKFGFSETFFIFSEFDRLRIRDIREFSEDAYHYAMGHKTIPLPCGLFESVWSYAVALAKSVDEQVLDSIRSETPPKHWASAEIPVVYDQSRRKLYYFEKTPLWGSAYYAGFRKQIVRLLGGIGEV